MTGNEYQKLAMRTATHANAVDQAKHALHGMVGEIGEIHSMYQKTFQGHTFNFDDAFKECGDLLWFLTEYIDAQGWHLDDVMNANIEKLKKRYPDGFSVERSVNRNE